MQTPSKQLGGDKALSKAHTHFRWRGRNEWGGRGRDATEMWGGQFVVTGSNMHVLRWDQLTGYEKGTPESTYTTLLCKSKVSKRPSWSCYFLASRTTLLSLFLPEESLHFPHSKITAWSAPWHGVNRGLRAGQPAQACIPSTTHLGRKHFDQASPAQLYCDLAQASSLDLSTKLGWQSSFHLILIRHLLHNGVNINAFWDSGRKTKQHETETTLFLLNPGSWWCLRTWRLLWLVRLHTESCSILWRALLTISSTFPLLRHSVLAPPSGQLPIELSLDASSQGRN